MKDKIDEMGLSQSIVALKQYIIKHEISDGRHKASLCIYANRKECGPVKRMVYVTAEEDFGKVIIEKLHTICSICSNTFTTNDSTFSLINGTLCIKNNDKLFGEISINISPI